MQLAPSSALTSLAGTHLHIKYKGPFDFRDFQAGGVYDETKPLSGANRSSRRKVYHGLLA